jgi:hypothetical protein
MNMVLIYKWRNKYQVSVFRIWLYFRNYFRSNKQRQVSPSTVTPAVTNVENRCFKITSKITVT